MEENNIIPNIDIKTIEIKEGENVYKCQIQIIKDFLQISLLSGNSLKYQGNIHISNIQIDLGIYYINIKEIFDEINLLNKDEFILIKDVNKYKLKIEFTILRKKRYMYIDLIENENKSLKQNDLIKTISELKEMIKNKDERIKYLEEELNKYKALENMNDNSYDNFNIKFKEPIHKLNYHTKEINCSIVLKDGRFATCSNDNTIIIYNSQTFKQDLKIKENGNSVYCITQLSSGVLASGSAGDGKIILYNINGNEYKIIQTLTYHKNYINKIIELKNKNLVSCSGDKTIVFYFSDNNEYIRDYSIQTNGPNSAVIQTKDNEICFSEENNGAICFFDLLERKMIKKINNISKQTGRFESLVMLKKDLLLVTGENKLSIINVNSHHLKKVIDVQDSGWITTACKLNKNMLLTVDYNKRVIQWKIQSDNLELISKKENAHDGVISTLTKLGNGHIITGSWDKFVKIW